MNREMLIDTLLLYFYRENKELKTYDIPDEVEEKREHLDNIIASREVKEIDERILELEDKLLNVEQQGLVIDQSDIDTIDESLGSDEECGDIIAIYKGDLTKIKCDAIVNTAKTFLGCKIPYHNCVDRKINRRAGIRLRMTCKEYLDNHEHVKNTIVTKAFNLPCKYIIHTIVPKVVNTLTINNLNDLAKCYIEVLEVAKQKGIRTIAIPCVATYDFRYPKEEAAVITYNTIKNFVKENREYFDKVIINVYSSENYNEYKKLV